ncbi:hypothetical protein BU15DRAFT_83492 [Melanogaster broomeanus]|nr:hypothetical protein BU15DRAFT_83492 [Melanogaster broomeanus]
MATALEKFKPYERPFTARYDFLDAKVMASRGIEKSYDQEQTVDSESLTVSSGLKRTAKNLNTPLAFRGKTLILRLTLSTGLVRTLKAEKIDGLESLYEFTHERVKKWKNNHGQKQDMVMRLVYSLRHDVMVLRRHPVMRRDIVVYFAQAQRAFLDIWAFMEYVEVVQPRINFPDYLPHAVSNKWMGAFTDQLRVCERLFHARVPVWLVRNDAQIRSDMNVEKPVLFTYPDHIVKALYHEASPSARPFGSIYTGPGGLSRHLSNRLTYTGGRPSPGEAEPQPGPSTGGATSSSSRAHQDAKVPGKRQSKRAQKGSHAASNPKLKDGRDKWLDRLPASSANRKPKGGRDKWLDPALPEIPPPNTFFQRAMKYVIKDASRVHPGLVDPGYRFPDPPLLVTSDNPRRKKLFIANWLTSRPLWMSRVDHDPPAKFPSPQMWRDFLISIQAENVETTPSGTFAATSRRAALEVFGEDVVVRTRGWRTGDTVSWRGMDISFDSLADPPVLLAKQILWELYELNFRYELYALDRVMAPELWASCFTERRALLHSIFPGDSGLLMWDDTLPKPSSDMGLCSATWIDARPSVDKFRELLSVWCDAPSRLSAPLGDLPDNQAAHLTMQSASDFYVQTFFDHFGRPPVVPHVFPFS